MTCAESRELSTNSRVKVEENGRVAVFINEDRARFHKVKLDDGVVKGELCADFAVLKESVGVVIVELKGTDIEHAVDQVEAAIELMKKCGRPLEKKGKPSAIPFAGLIVCSRYPKSDTSFQKKQKKFVAKHKAPLHCVSGRGEFKLEKVLRFDGPR
ncbi:TPA: hypothetical protein RNT04_003698 [Stenotrophomonas maltophilia]|uniref:hypothetical protein n=1 Tax=Stenotrophomonas TaxID=40323 RepID=UPI0013D988FB|nr:MULTISPECIES: hypothetical protein [Stenotrophomonas]MBH1606336.1 hypothetical protein [Stenotrophomonas maltophilia]MBN5080437.1 hypothetical protein [Stenotrophomonas maltophilia]MDQ7290471.1 hypothetical protein [Stenotrophomonas sp. Sm2128]MDT3470932.1 hypothetical protein [Stenotrophomonas maltophilia]HDS1833108.1 hypothetical protein [Stenotrophomonas maltophilia]